MKQLVDWRVVADQRVRGILRSLGGTHEAVAATLRRLGVRGRRNSFCRCPIAVVLDKAGVNLSPNGVDVAFVSVRGMPDVELPRGVLEFIYEFDHGGYSDLEAES